MLVNTSTLTDFALDWAVSQALGKQPVMRHDYMRQKAKDNAYTGDLNWHLAMQVNSPITVSEDGVTCLLPQTSTDWAQGGPIIEREFIEWHTYSANDNGVITWRCNDFMDGPTPLIAAMRAFVASKLGDTVEIPDELL